MKFIKNDGGREKDYPNCNLKKHQTGDCVIRAISIALEKPYKEVLIDLCDLAIELGYMPNSHKVYREYLKEKGWKETKFGKSMVRINSTKIPKNEWVICYIRKHLTAIKGNELHDIWNCSSKRVFRIYTKIKQLKQ